MAVRPWRLAVLAIAAFAAVELVLLVAAGGALLARDEATASPSAKPARAVPVTGTSARAQQTTKPAGRPTRATAVADLPRKRVTVVVLNGNGRQGAAAATASRVSRRGYRVGLVGNAGTDDYPRSIVMYRRGFAFEGKRLARDLGVSIVTPLDGMRPGQLRGAHAVLILGA